MNARQNLIGLVDIANAHAELTGNEDAAFVLTGLLISLIEGREGRLARDCRAALHPEPASVIEPSVN